MEKYVQELLRLNVTLDFDISRRNQDPRKPEEACGELGQSGQREKNEKDSPLCFDPKAQSSPLSLRLTSFLGRGQLMHKV